MTCARNVPQLVQVGCVCVVLGMEPAEVCEHGNDAATCLHLRGTDKEADRG